MKAAGTSGEAPTPESEDIAKLLRALNDDLRAQPIDDADLDGDEEDAPGSPGLPLGKIAAALVAAVGIGVAVVVLDPGGTPTAPATSTAELAPPAPAITRAAPASPPTATTNPPQGAPEPLIARAPAPLPPSSAPVAAPPPVAAAPAPPPAVSPPPAAPPSLRVPEPPALPPPGATVTRPVPATPVARQPDPPPVSRPQAPVQRAEAPAPDSIAPPPPAAPKAANTGELQAMLSPPREPRDTARTPAKPTEPKAAETRPAEPKAVESKPAPSAAKPAVSRPAAIPSGRYTVQIGTFKVAANADSLTRRLQGNGFSAYTLDWTDASNQSWRAVRVGGYPDAAAAKRAATQLKTKMGLDSAVVSIR